MTLPVKGQDALDLDLDPPGGAGDLEAPADGPDLEALGDLDEDFAERQVGVVIHDDDVGRGLRQPVEQVLAVRGSEDHPQVAGPVDDPFCALP